VQIAGEGGWDSVTVARIGDDRRAVAWEVTFTLSSPLDAIGAVLRVAAVALVDPTG
jgi:hypothetical protein